ncbi:MAG: hypothetical protein E6G38_10395 [Actinobacteria bacterium]|nr:MAG: hypothetical protein E6G38_10395 [Actinomycetota bacterium]
MQGVRRNRLDPSRRVFGLTSSGERTIVRLWRDAASAGRDDAAYLAEVEPGRWREVSWGEAARAVDELANGLLARGIRRGDAFGIVSRTRLEWTLFDFALALVGGITAPVYPNSSANEAAYLLQHAEVVGGLAEDETQLAKIEALGLAHVLTLADLEGLREQGIAFAREHPEALDAAAAAVDEEDIYTYIYTSGTTGPPKGCMIRHRNYYAMTSSIERVEDLWLGEDVMLLYLPLAHNFGRLMSLWGAYAGFTIAFCPDPYAVAEALPQVRPTLLPSVPRLYEKAHTARRLGGRGRPPGERSAPARTAAASSAGSPASDRRPAPLLEGQGALRRPPEDRHLGRSAARQGDRRAFPRTRHPDPRGLGPDRVHDGGDREPTTELSFRHGRAGDARRRGEDGARR